MSVLLTESFEQWANTNARLEQGKWTTHVTWNSGNQNAPYTAPGHGRTGVSGGGTRSISYSFSSKATIIIGSRVNGAAGGDDGMWEFYSGGALRVAVRVTSTGAIEVLRQLFPANLQEHITAPNLVKAVANYFWIKVTPGNPGSIEVYLNGSRVINESSLNLNSANVDQISLRSAGDYYDDIVIMDTLGGVADDIPLDGSGNAPDVWVQRCLPDVDGTHSDWTPLGAGTNEAEVDEDSNGTTGADDDTSYNSTSVVNDRDTFQVEDLVGSGATILAVNVILRARKDATGTRAIKAVSLHPSGTTTEELGDEWFLAEAYAWDQNIFHNDPDGNPFTVTKWNAEDYEFGYELTT